MPDDLPLDVASLDDAPDSIRTHYTKGNPEHGESSDRYYLRGKGTGGFGLENVTGLKTTLSETKERHRKARAQLDAYGELGDLDELRERLEELEELKRGDRKGKRGKRTKDDDGDDEAADDPTDRKRVDKASRERDDAVREREAMRLRLHEQMKKDAAIDGMDEAKFNKHRRLVLKELVSQLMVITDDDGDEQVVAKGKDGKPRVTEKRGSERYMDAEELALLLAEDDEFKDLVEGSNKSGVDLRAAGRGDRGPTHRRTADDDEPRPRPVERLKRFYAEKRRGA